jgi:hypothetical protein
MGCKMSLGSKYAVWILTMIFIIVFTAEAAPPVREQARQRLYFLYPISAPHYPVVLTGEFVTTLLDIPVKRIFLYAIKDSGLEPIPFQIDRRGPDGRFQIPLNQEEKTREGTERLDENDECVFMSADLGKKAVSIPPPLQKAPVTEIELVDPRTNKRGWVYAFVLDGAPEASDPFDYVSYNPSEDAIESEVYQARFARDTTFLINHLSWKASQNFQDSPDLTDMMKARHWGKLLYSIPFERTQDDSETRLIAVKDGPVRVIRSSVSRIRLIWKVHSPSIYVDNVHYGDSFSMDVFIDIPFKIGHFFSDLNTLMTMDGNDDPAIPMARVYSNALSEGADIDGRMSEREEKINGGGDKALVVDTAYGKILIALQHEKRMPIEYGVYIVDDRSRPDPPELIPGQFGNLGFISRGWQKLDPSVYHMVFIVYMIRDISVGEGFGLLRHTPSFIR